MPLTEAHHWSRQSDGISDDCFRRGFIRDADLHALLAAGTFPRYHLFIYQLRMQQTCEILVDCK